MKKANKSHQKAHAELYLKYVQDVQLLQAQNQELSQHIKTITKQMLTEEFLQADTDNNRQVTRQEYEMHKRNYLRRHPEMTDAQFPHFDEFDPDANGVISMAEHEGYYEKQGYL